MLEVCRRASVEGKGPRDWLSDEDGIEGLEQICESFWVKIERSFEAKSIYRDVGWEVNWGFDIVRVLGRGLGFGWVLRIGFGNLCK